MAINMILAKFLLAGQFVDLGGILVRNLEDSSFPFLRIFSFFLEDFFTAATGTSSFLTCISKITKKIEYYHLGSSCLV